MPSMEYIYMSLVIWLKAAILPVNILIHMEENTVALNKMRGM